QGCSSWLALDGLVLARWQLGGAAQRVVDASLPAWAGGAEVLYDIGIDAQLERELGVGAGRPAGAAELVAMVEVGLLELLLCPLGSIVGVDPRVARRCESNLPVTTPFLATNGNALLAMRDRAGRVLLRPHGIASSK